MKTAPIYNIRVKQTFTMGTLYMNPMLYRSGALNFLPVYRVSETRSFSTVNSHCVHLFTLNFHMTSSGRQLNVIRRQILLFQN